MHESLLLPILAESCSQTENKNEKFITMQIYIGSIRLFFHLYVPLLEQSHREVRCM